MREWAKVGKLRLDEPPWRKELEEIKPAFDQVEARTDNIFVFRLIIQQFERYNLPLILMFLDFIAAFDFVTRQELWKILENDGMPLRFVELMKAYYDASVSRVRVYGEETEEFLVEFGVKQGCFLSPTLFNYCID
ncbi:hypothetical protein QYM36_020071 [Artemia franciscana]|uniref:Reverse transcriptase domain-containing protein n=1 Tax=Artemia franciscana TaxID=6661 RepID=A0AA88KSS7_ARTSF|nr:hypothetical protein QYM36_020071 [Artemia franciscana]